MFHQKVVEAVAQPRPPLKKCVDIPCEKCALSIQKQGLTLHKQELFDTVCFCYGSSPPLILFAGYLLLLNIPYIP